jgi:hypothetical protein
VPTPADIVDAPDAVICRTSAAAAFEHAFEYLPEVPVPATSMAGGRDHRP